MNGMMTMLMSAWSLIHRKRKLWIGLILGYALLGFLVIPLVLERFLPHQLGHLLKSPVSIEAIHFNPFSFRLEIDRLALLDQKGAPVFSLGLGVVDVDLIGSLWHRAPSFSELRLEAPSLALTQEANGEINLLEMIKGIKSDDTPSPPVPEEAGLPGLLIESAALIDGAVSFENREIEPFYSTKAEHLSLTLDHVSTLKNQEGDYGIKALLPGGGLLDWNGTLRLSPLASAGALAITGLKLDAFWPYIKNLSSLSQLQGDLSLDLHYRLEGQSKQPSLFIEQTHLDLQGFSLSDAKAPLITLDHLHLGEIQLDLAAKTLAIPEFSLTKGQLHLTMDEAGHSNWEEGLKSPNKPTSAVSPPPSVTMKTPEDGPSPPWTIDLSSLNVDDMGVDATSQQFAVPLGIKLNAFKMAMNVHGVLGQGPPEIQIDHLGLGFRDFNLVTPGAQEPLLALQSFDVLNGAIDVAKRQVHIGSMRSMGLNAGITRSASGDLYPLSLFNSKNPPPVPQNTAAPQSPAFMVDLDEFTMDQVNVSIRDKSHPVEVAYDIVGLGLGIQKISSEAKAPIPFSVHAAIRQGGTIDFRGALDPVAHGVKADVQLDRLNLKPLDPFLGDGVALHLKDAQLSSKLAVNVQQNEAPLKGAVKGDLHLSNLQLVSLKGENKFLSWRDLWLRSLEMNLAPERLTIKEVRLIEPDGVVAVREDKQSNISDLFPAQKTAVNSEKEKLQAAPPLKNKAPIKARDKPSPFNVSIGRIVVEKGTLDFSDASLVIPFATRIKSFGGAIAGFSLVPKARINVDLGGRIEPYGEARIEGVLSPLAVRDYLDLGVVFRNVVMSSLSPYSATFAGRRIETGTLDLNLHYRVVDSALQSTNDIVLDNVTLGEKVESPKATSLPLELALSLLKDQDGKIKVSIPIEGRLDQPELPIGKIAFDALAGFLAKVVTAPFHAVGSLLGMNSSGDAVVLFDPGHATLSPPEEGKLKALIDQLAKTPSVKLIVHGGVMKDVDLEGLKTLAVGDDVGALTGVSLAPGELPDAVNTTDPAAQVALEKLIKESRDGDHAVVLAYQQETGRSPDRVNAVGGFFGKASATPDFYDRVFQTLVARKSLLPNALDTLASQRLKSLMDAIESPAKRQGVSVVKGAPVAGVIDASQRVGIPIDLGAQ